MFKNLLDFIIVFIALDLGWSYKASLRVTELCLGHEWGEFVANPSDCRLFYLCGKDGEAALASCPPNMLFNPQTKICDNPKNVDCESLTSEGATTPLPATVQPPIAASSQADQYCYNLDIMQRNSNALLFLPHPLNCHQYYMCYHGQALLQSCSPKLLWNSKLNKCDLSANVACLRPNAPGGVEEEEGVEILPAVQGTYWQEAVKCPLYGEHIFPHIKRCDSFIYCVNGQAILQTCPFYQYFDVESGRCRWRIKAKCVKDLNLKYG
ncbi:uncharacterized protein ACRADG_002374 [Cochliomyia hominivorax]